VLVYLAKLPLCVGFIPAVDHEAFDDQAMPRADAKANPGRAP
jgi:hypothetical protein